jgi:hypothetical protein
VPSERAGRGAEDDRIQVESSSARAIAPHDDERVEAHGYEHAFWKTAGPARLGVTDRGLTFATNGERGC